MRTSACPGEVGSGSPTRTCANTTIYCRARIFVVSKPIPRAQPPFSFIRQVRPFMPRDNDRNSGPPRGRRDGAAPGKGRSGAARGPEKKFAKRGFAGNAEGAGGPEKKSYGKKPYSGSGKPYAGKREGAAPRRDDDRAPRRDYGDAPRR